MSDNPYQMPDATLQSADPTAEDTGAPQGIAGWLFLPAIYLIINPFIVCYTFFVTFVPLFRDGEWAKLTNSGAPLYSPFWEPYLVFKISGHPINLLLGLYVMFNFFRRSRKTPRLFIIMLAWRIAEVMLDCLGQQILYHGVIQVDILVFLVGTIKTITISAIGIAYFSVSKRVKATFVRSRGDVKQTHAVNHPASPPPSSG